jgi:tetratricopeptide (TPR) repeat protein
MLKNYLFIKYLQLMSLFLILKRSVYLILFRVRKKVRLYQVILRTQAFFSWRYRIKFLEFYNLYGEAITLCYKKLQREKNRTPFLYVALARNLGNINRFDDALHAIKQAKDLNPYYAELYYQEGIIYFLKKRFFDARKSLEFANKLGYNAAPLFIHLGKIYYQLGLLDRAEKCFRRVINFYPEEGSIYFLLAVVLLNKMQLADAEIAFLKAIEFGSNQKEEHLGLAEIYTRRGDWEKAIFEYKYILRELPDCFVAHYFLGLIYDIQGKDSEAIEELIKANKINPHDEDTKGKLTQLLSTSPMESYQNI